LAEEINGYYCLGAITKDGESYIARCPLATKPLMIGEGRKGYAAVTESRALRKIGIRNSRDVKPGEILKIDRYGVLHPVKTIKGKHGMKLCTFLYGYYGWIDSRIEGIPVSAVREAVAAKIVESDRNIKFDFGTAIEDSGKAYGEEGAAQLKIPYRSALIKYPYFLRSYERGRKERRKEAMGKVSSVEDRIKDKILLVFDDSLRRGTVTEEGSPMKYAWDDGAKEIHLRFGTPRNTHQCRLDFIDRPDENLPANRFPTDEGMAGYLNVTSVRFPTVDQYADAIMECAKRYGSNLKREDLCLGCYNGDFSFLE
jgi:amidophosphoribosyltransferase